MAMKAIFHLITSKANHRVGGLEESLYRIAAHLLTLGDTRVQILSRKDAVIDPPLTDSRLQVRSILCEKEAISPPKLNSKFTEDTGERYRLDMVLLSNHVENHLRQFPEYRHVLISFYVSTAGFLAQHVAQRLGLPHIASVRGSDFSNDFHTPGRFAGFEYVMRFADFIITTNQAQEAALRRLGRTHRIRTIPNALNSALPSPMWERKTRPVVQLFTDTGYSTRKGTTILCSAVSQALEEGVPLRLKVVGHDEEGREAEWKAFRAHLSERYPGTFDFGSYVEKSAALEALAESDVYCSATLGEGSSNSANTALSIGIPMVCTATGNLPELVNGCRHIWLCRPGDPEDFKRGLKEAVQAIALESEIIDQHAVAQLRHELNPERERRAWEETIGKILPQQRSVVRRGQARVLFLAKDGPGLGHLQRISRLAEAIQGPCASLVLCGHRSTAWMVSESCEFIHIPSLDSLLPLEQNYWGRQPFVEMERARAMQMRAEMIQSVAKTFRPDAIVVDYLPSGKDQEWLPAIELPIATRYFIVRGVLGDRDIERRQLLGDRGAELLERKYDRILIACDQRICNVVEEYGFSPSMAAKAEYIGYVSQPIPPALRMKARQERQLAPNETWVVCSAGGGALGEKLIQECYQAALSLPQTKFDIVVGPRSALPWQFCSVDIHTAGNIRYQRESRHLAMLHAAADVVVCAGGYNSLVETLEGRARIISCPAQVDVNDEQYTHARRLQKFCTIKLVPRPEDLPAAIQVSIEEAAAAPLKTSGRNLLDFGGAERFRSILLNDLGMVGAAATASP
jgi:predicted glycosyltransferase/glycosyltransferase involved in cell wall biosynthesis